MAVEKTARSAGIDRLWIKAVLSRRKAGASA
jgi:hypothetical protein